LLRLEKVTKYFNPNTVNQKTALMEVCLNLAEGDFITVIGSNGAGKSTLLNAVAGVYPIDMGKIELDGKDITSLPEHKRASSIGRVFQDPMRGTAPTMTVEENLSMAMARGKKRGLKLGICKDQRQFFCDRLALLELGLENRLKDKVGLLSGGQRQAITLLMATMTQPKLLLLDEHTAALDPKTGKKIVELTKKVVGENHLTTLMVTHNMEQALNLGNRLIMMHEGRIILELAGEFKEKMTVKGLLQEFEHLRGEAFVSDRVMLAT
jgi:putative ABC transport system ATP-binding protein